MKTLEHYVTLLSRSSTFPGFEPILNTIWDAIRLSISSSVCLDVNHPIFANLVPYSLESPWPRKTKSGQDDQGANIFLKPREGEPGCSFLPRKKNYKLSFNYKMKNVHQKCTTLSTLLDMWGFFALWMLISGVFKWRSLKTIMKNLHSCQASDLHASLVHGVDLKVLLEHSNE